MRLLFMLRGIQGAGKSYDIKRLNLENYTISADTIRIMNGSLIPYTDESSIIDNFNDETVWLQLMNMLENRMIYGQTTIIDTTGLYDTKKIQDMAKAYRYRIVDIVYDKLSVDECYKNVIS